MISPIFFLIVAQPRHVHAGSGAPEEIAQQMPHLPSTMPPQLPLHSSSWYIPSETVFVRDTSTAGPNPEPLASNSTVCDNGHSGHGDCCLGWEISAPARGYDAHLQGHPPGLPVSLSRSLNGRGGTSDGLFPRFKAYGTIYTDDVRMKLGDAIRRQCFNCRATQTTTWRRSTLSLGKLVRLTGSLGWSRWSRSKTIAALQ